jgi:hypothetical protein
LSRLVIPKFIKSFKKLRSRRSQAPEEVSAAAVAESRLTLPRYSMVMDSAVIEAAFARMRNLFEENLYDPKKLAPRYQFERGRLAEDRSYFYLAPWHEEGWLFERGPTGWIVSRAEKIVQQNTFMRRAEAFDSVTLYQADGEKDACLRLESIAMGPDLMTFPVYAVALQRSLDLEPALL